MPRFVEVARGEETTVCKMFGMCGLRTERFEEVRVSWGVGVSMAFLESQHVNTLIPNVKLFNTNDLKSWSCRWQRSNTKGRNLESDCNHRCASQP